MADKEWVMSAPNSVITLRLNGPLVAFVTACSLAITSLGFGLASASSSPETRSQGSDERITVSMVNSSTVPQSQISSEATDFDGVYDSFMSSASPYSDGPEVDIPINQTLVVSPAMWKRILPRPILLPVETEWVPGFNIDLLSQEKIAEILAQASQLKDVEPFAPGSGANSNERMPSWLASDRTVVEGTPRAYAVLMLVNYGWGIEQWPYLDRMWWHESGWDPQTVDEMQGNGYGEFDPTKTWGIPQANPASKMASAGDDWMTNPETQIRWGLGYIKNIYGSPKEAWEAWRARAATGSYGWY